MSPRDDEHNTAKVAAYRLLLAQLNDDTDAMSIVERELAPELLERPDHVRNVLGAMLGVASGPIAEQTRARPRASDRGTAAQAPESYRCTSQRRRVVAAPSFDSVPNHEHNTARRPDNRHCSS